MPYPSTLTGWRQAYPPPAASRVFYSYRIMVPALAGPAGQQEWKVVGTFQNFNPTSTRQVIRVRGIANNGGWPLELVPGPADVQVNVTYLALYLLPLSAALGFHVGSVVDLNYHRVPFDIQEICVFPLSMAEEQTSRLPDSVPGAEGQSYRLRTIETNHYTECYLSNIGRTVNQGTVTIAETATIQVTKVEPVEFPAARPPGYGIQEYESVASLG